MDGISSLFWQSLIADEEEDKVVEKVALQFDASAEHIRDDFNKFRESCIHRGLLAEGSVRHVSQNLTTFRINFHWGRWLPAWLHALSCHIRVSIAQRRSGFSGVYKLAQKAACRLSTVDSKYDSDCNHSIDTARRAFIFTDGIVSTGRDIRDCLPRSVALLLLLRERNINATHIVAIRHRPFAGHAYVMIDGVPFLEDNKGLQQFVPLAILPTPPDNRARSGE